MKKISLWKKLSLGLGTCAVAVPLALTATSCTTNHIEVKYISFDDFAETTQSSDIKLTDKFNTGKFGFDKMLLGSKKFFDGNYFLFVGSNVFDTTNKFFGGEKDRRTTEQWFTDYLSDSFWNIDVTARSHNEDLIDTNFGFVYYVDDFDFKFYDKEGHEIYLAKSSTEQYHVLVSPFDKWDDTLITQTKEFNRELGYEWDDESVEVGDYIREDESAKSYREFCKKGLAYFPTTEGGRTKTFDVGDGNKTSLMLVYKEGKLKDILDLPQDSYNGSQKPEDNDPKTLYGAINKYFPLEEPEEPEPPQPEPEKI